MLQNYTFIADKRGVRRSFLLFFSLFLLQVTAFAQNDVRITIRENNITVIEALKKVEKQSGLSIGYNNSLLRDKPALNLNLDKAGLDYSLSTILKGTGCTYELKGKYIKIIPQPAQEKPSSDKQIKGKVTDETGEPLIGVNIQVQGSASGVITDIEGRYSIEAPVGSTLNFTYIGYTPQNVKVTDRSVYNVTLATAVEQLNEVSSVNRKH